MKTTLPAFTVIFAAACLTTIMPAAFAFGIATRAADLSTLVSSAAAKQSYKPGQLVIEAPWARATPEGAQSAAGISK